MLRLLSEMFFDHETCHGPSLVCSSDLSRYDPFLESVCIIALSHVDSESHLLNQYRMRYGEAFPWIAFLLTTVTRFLLILIAILILRLFLMIILQKQDISRAVFSNLRIFPNYQQFTIDISHNSTCFKDLLDLRAYFQQSILAQMKNLPFIHRILNPI